MDWFWICLGCGATIVSDSTLFRGCSREESRCQVCNHEFPTPLYIPDMNHKPTWGILWHETLWYETDMSDDAYVSASWLIDWWA